MEKKGNYVYHRMIILSSGILQQQQQQKYAMATFLFKYLGFKV